MDDQRQYEIWDARVENSIYDLDFVRLRRNDILPATPNLEMNFHWQAGESDGSTFEATSSFSTNECDFPWNSTSDDSVPALGQNAADTSTSSGGSPIVNFVARTVRPILGRRQSEPIRSSEESAQKEFPHDSRRFSEGPASKAESEMDQSTSVSPPTRYPGPPYPDPNPKVCFSCRKQYPNHPWRWNHKDIDWDTGEYVCPRLAQKVYQKRSKENLKIYCSYCAKGDPARVKTHSNKCPITKKVTCPALRSLPECQFCGAYGDDAHTNTACPRKPPTLV